MNIENWRELDRCLAGLSDGTLSEGFHDTLDAVRLALQTESRKADKREIRKSLRMGSMILGRFARGLEQGSGSGAYFDAGVLYGMVCCMESCRYGSAQAAAESGWFQRKRAALQGVPHADEIILALHKRIIASLPELKRITLIGQDALADSLDQLRIADMICEAENFGKTTFWLSKEGGRYAENLLDSVAKEGPGEET